MIIDVHYHLMPAVSERSVAHPVHHVIRAAEIMGRKLDPAEVTKRALEAWPDPTGEKLIAGMEESGVDLTVICMVDNADIELLTVERIMGANKLIADIAKNYPGRVLALAGIDPRRPTAPDMMKQCFEEFGMRGLKYHPDNGHLPAGPESYKVLEVVAKNDGILLSHTGPLPPPARPKFSEPALLSDLAVDFPEINVIGAHMGGIDWRSWGTLAAHQPTLFGDLAMWDAYAFGNYDLFCRELRDILDYAGRDKVLFGTDNPIFCLVEPTKNWIQLIKDLPNNAPDGINFTHDETAAILGGNAAKVLKLDA